MNIAGVFGLLKGDVRAHIAGLAELGAASRELGPPDPPGPVAELFAHHERLQGLPACVLAASEAVAPFAVDSARVEAGDPEECARFAAEVAARAQQMGEAYRAGGGLPGAFLRAAEGVPAVVHAFGGVKVAAGWMAAVWSLFSARQPEPSVLSDLAGAFRGR